MYAAFYAREQVMRTLLSKCPPAVVAATVDLKLDADVLHTGKTALHLAGACVCVCVCVCVCECV